MKVKCYGLNEEGYGLVEMQGKKLVLKNVLPGEIAHLKQMKHRYTVERIENNSEQRQRVTCKHFMKCGGCQLLHMSTEAQAQFKQDMIGQLFPKNHINPIVSMENPFHYRHKVIATFSQDKQRNLIAGVYEEGSHSVCEVKDCLIQHELANQIIRSIVQLAKQMRYPAFDEDRKTGFLRHCLLRVSHAYDEVLVCLVVSKDTMPGSKQFIQKLRQAHPEIKSIVLNVNARTTSVVLGEKEKVLFGTGVIKDRLSGFDFYIGTKTFYQINPIQTQKLYDIAIKMANLKPTDHVLDAYCGIGTITLSMSRHARHVVGVEINRHSIKQAIQNAKSNQIKNVTFIAQDCGEYMVAAAKQKVHFDCVMMDPAREGSDERFLSSLISLKPSKIVYISCGPTSQKRDVDYLKKHNYKITQIQPVDLFCGTSHIENIVLLQRS